MKKYILILIAFSLILVFFFSLFEIRKVVGTSMEPTIKSGETLLFRKSTFGSLSRADVVSFQKDGVINIGRVVGLPTESVRIENGNVYIDDNVDKWRMIEEYVNLDSTTEAEVMGKWFQAKNNEYIILPDNRNNKINLEKMIIKRNEIKSVLITKI